MAKQNQLFQGRRGPLYTEYGVQASATARWLLVVRNPSYCNSLFHVTRLGPEGSRLSSQIREPFQAPLSRFPQPIVGCQRPNLPQTNYRHAFNLSYNTQSPSSSSVPWLSSKYHSQPPCPKLHHFQACMRHLRAVSNADGRHQADASAAGHAIKDEESLATGDSRRLRPHPTDSHQTASASPAQAFQRRLQTETKVRVGVG